MDLILTCIHLTNFLEKKNSADWLLKKGADENLHFQRHTHFFVNLQCLVLELLFLKYFVFRRQPAEFFFSKNNLSNKSRSV